jgi:hypothetical protein
MTYPGPCPDAVVRNRGRHPCRSRRWRGRVHQRPQFPPPPLPPPPPSLSLFRGGHHGLATLAEHTIPQRSRRALGLPLFCSQETLP